MKYEFVDHIATGGFGKVEKVRGEDGQLYARKTFELDKKMIDDGFEENAKKRFIYEAKYQAGISHKNVVPVLELFVKENPPYFIMPLAHNSLEKDTKNGHIDSSNFMFPVLDILSGLEEIHSLDVYHRDLKPSNVLRFSDNEGADYYAIGDFGLMSVTQRTGLTVLTSTAMAKNSDLYTAPEITQHLKNGTIASDIYSVGCIIHDFVGTGSRVPCNEIVDGSTYSDILSTCTKNDPKKRFKSVTSLRDLLATFDTESFEAKTEIGIRITEYLSRNPVLLNENEIEEITNYISSQEDTGERHNAVLQIDLDHIKVIKESNSLGRFASVYFDFIKSSSFQWNTCDALASRINFLISGESISVQAEGIMALLYMGTRHNRWYVERLFVDKVGHSADEKLIRRLNIQFSVDDKELCYALSHLTYSIDFSYESLHPTLYKTVKTICKL
ncbi:MAG TPA: protein kinase [Pedobacter sp.]|uniref:protein kinase domain-containing protein n=1 Tax=Pedobacter sp. TaxID=1411316 RepID=UPI002C01A778|nr:protein kinase [Pedobacter sp.]HMI02484.1 protein kinase [Pedobacter sp.]